MNFLFPPVLFLLKAGKDSGFMFISGLSQYWSVIDKLHMSSKPRFLKANLTDAFQSKRLERCCPSWASWWWTHVTVPYHSQAPVSPSPPPQTQSDQNRSPTFPLVLHRPKPPRKVGAVLSLWDVFWLRGVFMHSVWNSIRPCPDSYLLLFLLTDPHAKYQSIYI